MRQLKKSLLTLSITATTLFFFFFQLLRVEHVLICLELDRFVALHVFQIFQGYKSDEPTTARRGRNRAAAFSIVNNLRDIKTVYFHGLIYVSQRIYGAAIKVELSSGC